MLPIGPNPNSYKQNLDSCPDQSLLGRTNNEDGPPGSFCHTELDNQNEVNNKGVGDWLDDTLVKNLGNGAANNSDPMQAGKILNDIPAKINGDTVYRYSKSIRGTDEAVMDLFRNIVVIDEDGKAIQVPIIWGTQERAVAAILQQNVRKDETLVVDRIKLPMLAISSTGMSFDAERYTYHQALRYLNTRTGQNPNANPAADRGPVFGVARGIPLNIEYTLYAWTMQLEDMNQILEQIVTKFSLVAYIKVRGVLQDVIVKLESIANNLETEPGDQALRVIKFQFGLTAQTYVPMPVKRYDNLINTFRGEIVDAVELDEVTQVLGRIREAGGI